LILILVVLGAAVGAPARYLTDRMVQQWRGRLTRRRPARPAPGAVGIPWGTFVVNVAGSFILGAVAASGADGPVVALLGVGFCGALTTYSTFGFETVRLLEVGAYGSALANVAGSIGAGLAAAMGGAALVTLI
jgi:CrcB protein